MNARFKLLLFWWETPNKSLNLLILYIGVDRFDSMVSLYLVNLYNYLKTEEKEIQVDFFYSIDELQVWKEDQGAQAFKVFVYLKQKISYFKDELEDEFV